MVLVSVGENRRIVSFSSTPASTDAEVLSKAIKETFGDILKSDQEFFIQAKNEEWGGLFLDVLDQEIVDKTVVNVLLKPQTHEVSCCELIIFKNTYKIQAKDPDVQKTMKLPTVVLQPSVGVSMKEVQSYQYFFMIMYKIILCILQGSRQMHLQVSGGAVELAAPSTSEVGGCLVTLL